MTAPPSPHSDDSAAPGAVRASLASDQQRAAVHAIRDEFFNALLGEWTRPAEPIDRMMEQDDALFVPDHAAGLGHDPKTIFVRDVPRGLLAVSVTPPMSRGIPNGLRWVYSIMQAGDWIRFGVMIQGAPQVLLRYEQHHDNILAMERIWDRQCDYQFRDSAGLLLEWRFSEPGFYDSFVVRERFIIMARHMHFRLGKVLRPLLDDIALLYQKHGADWIEQSNASHVQDAPIATADLGLSLSGAYYGEGASSLGSAPDTNLSALPDFMEFEDTALGNAARRSVSRHNETPSQEPPGPDSVGPLVPPQDDTAP